MREKEKGKLVPTPQIVYDQISYQEKPVPRRRTFGLLAVGVFVLIAFLVGGGVGGGVGAVAARDKSRYVVGKETLVGLELIGKIGFPQMQQRPPPQQPQLSSSTRPAVRW